MHAEPLGRVLTAAEYDHLPENPLRELVDGVIRMVATPTSWHQYVVRELGHMLDLLAKPDLRAVGPIEIRLADDNRRNPDVAVVHGTSYGRNKSRYLPVDVVLAIEVVSPGSEAGAYAPVGVFRAGQTVQVEGLEWATITVADLAD